MFSAGGFSQEVEEITDYFPWKYKGDEVKKICYAKVSKFNYLIALRKSGLVDLYVNMDRVSTITEKTMKDIAFDAHSLYFKDMDDKVFELNLLIDLTIGLEVGWSQAKPVAEGFNWDKIDNGKLIDFAKPF